MKKIKQKNKILKISLFKNIVQPKVKVHYKNVNNYEANPVMKLIKKY